MEWTSLLLSNIVFLCMSSTYMTGAYRSLHSIGIKGPGFLSAERLKRALEPLISSSDKETQLQHFNTYFLTGLAFGGGGLGAILGCLLVFVGSLLLTGTFGENTMDFGFVPGFLLGFMGGSFYAMRCLRRARLQPLTYAELRERRLSTYSSAWYRPCAVLTIMVTLLLTVLFQPLLGPMVSFASIKMSSAPWMLALWPAAMILLVTGEEWLLFSLARLPRFIILSDAWYAWFVDERLRTIAIRTGQSWSLFAVGILFNAQISFLKDSVNIDPLWSMHSPTWALLLNLAPWFSVLPYLIGFCIGYPALSEG